MKGGVTMELNTENVPEINWQEINVNECEESSLLDMCSWAEAN